MTIASSLLSVYMCMYRASFPHRPTYVRRPLPPCRVFSCFGLLSSFSIVSICGRVFTCFSLLCQHHHLPCPRPGSLEALHLPVSYLHPVTAITSICLFMFHEDNETSKQQFSMLTTTQQGKCMSWPAAGCRITVFGQVARIICGDAAR